MTFIKVYLLAGAVFVGLLHAFWFNHCGPISEPSNVEYIADVVAFPFEIVTVMTAIAFTPKNAEIYGPMCHDPTHREAR